MKLITFFIFLFSFGFLMANAQATLLISEYIEGSSNNKAIEIWNNSSEPVDLTGVQLEVYIDGSTNATTTIFLTTGFILAPGDVFVLCHPLATFADNADQTSFSAAWDGNDAIVLRDNGVIQDSIGQVGFAPPTEWGTGNTSTADNTLRRQTGNNTADTNSTNVYDPSVIFLGFPIDDFSNLGISPAPLLFLKDESLTVSNTFFCLRLTGPVNSLVVIEGSSDLQSWTPVQTNLCTTNGIGICLPSGTNSIRFFRARLQ